MNHSILIIYTGGTIGMKTDPQTGVLSPFNFAQIQDEVPELKKFGIRIDAMTFDPIIDSSNLTPEVWSKLSLAIKENYDHYDGFVILHGTDTMAYSASALSFMTKNLSKPIIFTGSQIPIGVLRTDGKENLISAIEIAAAQVDGHALVPEVCIYFQNQLFRGNRTVKHNADHFNAFRSENYPALADAGINITYNWPYIRQVAEGAPEFDVTTTMDDGVIILKLFPGISRHNVCGILEMSGLRGVVLETYGSGNAPTEDWFIDAVAGAIRRGIVVVNVTQCQAGSVSMDRYETGVRLQAAGVVSGHDITTEAAVTKLMYILGQHKDSETVETLMNRSIRGEMTV